MDHDGGSVLVSLVLLCVLLAASALVLTIRRKLALRYSSHDVDAAWYSYAMFCQRMPVWFSIIWSSAVLAALPIEMVRPDAGGGIDGVSMFIYGCLFLAGLGLLQLASTVISHRTLIQLGGPELSLADRLQACIWSMLVTSVPLTLFAIGGTAANALQMRLAALACLTAYGALFAGRLKLPGSRGLVTESVTTGPMKESVNTIAAKARVAIRRLCILYSLQTPLANAFALNGNIVMLSERLIGNLTRREVDAIVGHEITHLRFRHPKKYLLLLTYLCLLLPVCLFAMLLSQHPSYTGDAWLTPYSALVGLFTYAAVSRRNETVCDRGAVELTRDPEALISGLTKIYSLNRIPTESRGWLAVTSTHPSLSDRITRIRALNLPPVSKTSGVDPVSADDVNTPDSSKYELPAFPGHHLPVSSRLYIQNSSAVSALTMIASLVLPPAVTALLAQRAALEDGELWIAWAAGAFFTAAVYLLVSNFRSSRFNRTLESKLRAQMSSDGVDVKNGVFVYLAPDDKPGLYSGSYSSDIGFAVCTPDRLEFYGERTRFVLNRADIAGIEAAIPAPGVFKYYGVTLRWRSAADSSEGCLTLRPAVTRSYLTARSFSSSWLCELRDWVKEIQPAFVSKQHAPELATPPLTTPGAPVASVATFGAYARTALACFVFTVLVVLALEMLERANPLTYIWYPLLMPVLGSAHPYLALRSRRKPAPVQSDTAT